MRRKKKKKNNKIKIKMKYAIDTVDHGYDEKRTGSEEGWGGMRWGG